MTEAQMERAADLIVWRRLSTDSTYLNAENAVAQAEREEQISEQVWSDLVARHGAPA
jgi:ribosomal protein L20A (L18A)